MFNEDGSRRGILAIVGDIKAKVKDTNVQESILADLFGAKTVDGIKKISRELTTAGAMLSAKGGLARAAGLEQTTMRAAMGRLSTVFTMLADKALAPALNEFANALTKLTPEQIASLGNAVMALGRGLGFLMQQAMGFFEWITKTFPEWLQADNMRTAAMNEFQAAAQGDVAAWVNSMAGLQGQEKANTLRRYSQYIREHPELGLLPKGQAYSRMASALGMPGVIGARAFGTEQAPAFGAPINVQTQTVVQVDGAVVADAVKRSQKKTEQRGKTMAPFSDPNAFALVGAQ
jgi:hypothetical protein